jgi:hypothetical protein
LSFFISDFFWFAERLVSVNSLICTLFCNKIFSHSKTWPARKNLLTVLFPNTFLRSTFASTEYWGSSAACRSGEEWSVSLIHYHQEGTTICNSIDQITNIPGKDGPSGVVWYHHLDSEKTCMVKECMSVVPCMGKGWKKGSKVIPAKWRLRHYQEDCSLHPSC